MPKDRLLTDDELMERRQELVGKRFPILSSGGITLMDFMGSDRRIVDAARTTSDIKAVSDKDDRNLIRYLMRHRHSTPVEFPMVAFLVECPMDTWRQWIRHRTASVNEFSSRYSEVPDVNDVTPPDAWRHQSKSNRQGSSGNFVTEFPEGYSTPMVRNDAEPPPRTTAFTVATPRGGLPLAELFETPPTPGDYLTAREHTLHAFQREVYEERLKFGVAKEQARKDLCLSTYTRAWWQNDLHNTLHFLGLRCDSHAQKEIRDYANKMLEILEQLFPVTCQAFRDYRLDAMQLTALDIQVIQNLQANAYTNLDYQPQASELQQGIDGKRLVKSQPASLEAFLASQHDDWKDLKNCRERDECLSKLQKLGLVVRGS